MIPSDKTNPPRTRQAGPAMPIGDSPSWNALRSMVLEMPKPIDHQARNGARINRAPPIMASQPATRLALLGLQLGVTQALYLAVHFAGCSRSSRRGSRWWHRARRAQPAFSGDHPYNRRSGASIGEPFTRRYGAGRSLMVWPEQHAVGTNLGEPDPRGVKVFDVFPDHSTAVDQRGKAGILGCDLCDAGPQLIDLGLGHTSGWAAASREHFDVNVPIRSWSRRVAEEQ